MLETKSKQFISMTAFVLTIFTFKTWLETGQRFAIKVHKEAKLLYGSNELLPIIEAHPEDIEEKNNAIYTEAKNKVVEFLAGADLYIIRKQTKLAAFMLHQATEQCLHAMFELNTGMYLATHNIDKLLRYCSMICYRLPEIFPRNNKKEERLFQLLQKAYVGGRYDNNYSITVTELQEIRERVMELKELMNENN
ncbi:MAG: HEPN domain-containing protein [Ginsengibacter sp.]